jgi:4-hydroxybenzoate polyprenyltransferase
MTIGFVLALLILMQIELQAEKSPKTGPSSCFRATRRYLVSGMVLFLGVTRQDRKQQAPE